MAASASQWISCYGSESASAIIYSKTVWAEYLVDRMPRHLRPRGAAVHQAKMAFCLESKLVLPNGCPPFYLVVMRLSFQKASAQDETTACQAFKWLNSRENSTKRWSCSSH